MGRLKVWNDDAGEWQYTDGGESGGSQPGVEQWQPGVDVGFADVPTSGDAVVIHTFAPGDWFASVRMAGSEPWDDTDGHFAGDSSAGFDVVWDYGGPNQVIFGVSGASLGDSTLPIYPPIFASNPISDATLTDNGVQYGPDIDAKRGATFKVLIAVTLSAVYYGPIGRTANQGAATFYVKKVAAANAP